MSIPRGAPPAELAERPEVGSLLLDDLVTRQPLLVVINAVLASIVAALFWPVVGAATAIGWLCAFLSTQLGRLWAWRHLHRRPERKVARASLMTLTSAVTGAGWGAAGILFFVSHAPHHQVLMPFILAGLCAGAVISLPVHMPAFYAFYIPTLLPYSARLLLEGGPVDQVMGCITLLFGLGIGAVGLQLGRNLQRSAAIGVQNALLVGVLQEARLGLEQEVAARMADLSASNAQLLEEIEQRRISEAKVRHLLQHDPLTGLPNRLLFQDRLRQAILTAQRQRSPVAVLMLDLDRFKEVNDSRGHPTGDRLLQAVASRLSTGLRASDTLARLGGDEFAIVQVGLTGLEGAVTLADKLLGTLARPITLDGEEIHPGASIGIALYPEHGIDPDTLLSNADMALYAAKAQRHCWRLFHPSMHEALHSRRQLDTDLRRALDGSELLLHYQPRYELAGGGMTGVEALVRWQHPTRGLLSPGAFIPLAESSGLIRPLGRWVLGEACRQAARWHRAGRPLRVSVNLSPAQFEGESVSGMVTAVLAATGLEADRLELEITESLYLEHASDAVFSTLRDLRAAGVTLSIDDFGTGYSSLSYLKHLPFDVLKIDSSFIRQLARDAEDKAIVQAIVTLAHSLGKQAVAEGVETEAQLAMLRTLACDEAQGFWLARPVTAREV